MTVLTFGTFDIIHPGHLDFFKQAKQYGDRLVVCIARDETVAKIKGRRPAHNEKERLDAAAQLPIVDETVLGDDRDYYRVAEMIRPDTIALGYDQTAFVDRLSEELKRRGLSARIVRLRAYHPEKYKSSKIRK